MPARIRLGARLERARELALRGRGHFGRREVAVHVVHERHEGGAAAVDADLARQLAQLRRRFVGACVGLASRDRQRALEEPVQAGGELRASADLRDLDDLVHQRRQAVGIFAVLERASEDDHHAGERCLSEVGGDVEARGAGGRRRRDAQLGPETAAIEVEALERVTEDRIEQHDLAGRASEPCDPVRRRHG